MEQIRDIQKKYCSQAILTAIIVGGFLIVGGYQPLGKGLILGTLFSILNFILMAQFLSRRIQADQTRAAVSAFGSLAVRYLFLAIPIIAAIKTEMFNIFAVIIGLVMVQAAILIDHIKTHISTMRGNKA